MLSRLFDAVMNGSMSASYEDGSDWEANGMRCAVRVRALQLGGRQPREHDP